MRKQPRQSRSTLVVDSILEATTRLLPHSDGKRVSTNHIAQVAGTSIGSVYQYFKNLDSILVRLIEKDLDSNEEEFVQFLATLKSVPLDQKIEGLVEKSFEVFMRRRTFKRALLPHIFRLKRFRDVISARTVLATHVTDLFSVHADELKLENLERSAYVVSHAIQGLLQVVIVSHESPYSDAELKAEIVRIIRGYLGLSVWPR